jgi:N-acetyl sugar amidotransferase
MAQLTSPILSPSDPRYRMCSLSVMDNIADPDIRFDAEGVCNYYHEYRIKAASGLVSGPEARLGLEKVVAKIREDGRGKPYDCIMGLSGGVDSTYLAYLSKELGLRPLAVHLDNGWNSELAVMNIQGVVSKLGMDLHTHVIDWEEFRDLQIAYLKASVVDIEVLTDHAIIWLMYKLAGKMDIGYILSGTNIQTESTMPRTWVFNKQDHVNIRAIHARYGTMRMKTYPMSNLVSRRFYSEYKRLRTVSPLNFVDYDKAAVKEVIKREFGWRDYGGKHYESIWTRFYQGYILPAKFHIDKRKPHLSDLIFSGQISREDAIQELAKPGYDPVQYREDKDFVLKKLRLTETEFGELMSLPPRSHYDFDHKRPIEERMPLLIPMKRLFRMVFPVDGRGDKDFAG